jgi:hypothetical protein
MKIYLVEEGHYDRQVLGVYESRPLAQNYIDSIEGERELSIEEWELNEPNPESYKDKSLYFLRIDQQEEVKEIRKVEKTPFKISDALSGEVGRDVLGNKILTVVATDTSEAINIGLRKLKTS